MKKKKTNDKTVENHKGDTNCSKNPLHVEIENAVAGMRTIKFTQSPMNISTTVAIV